MYYTWLSSASLVCEETLVHIATNPCKITIDISNLSALDVLTHAAYRTVVSVLAAELWISIKLELLFFFHYQFSATFVRNFGP